MVGSCGIKEWLWVIAHPQFCLFRAADTRSRVELEQLLGTEYRGVLSSDDFSAEQGKLRLRSTTGIVQPRNRNVWHTYDDIFCD